MRIRMEFTKGEELRFVSHLDLLKTFERAMRRADVPLAFSEGFNPHPKMSFAAATAVGVTSAREYVDIETAGDVDAAEIMKALNSVLPKGLEITVVEPVVQGLPALMATVNRARYTITVGLKEMVTTDELADAIHRLLRQEQIMVTRTTKKGLREKDIRPGIEQLSGRMEENKIIFEVLLHTGGELNIRPDEVVQALKAYFNQGLEIDYVQIHKEGLYVAGEDALFTPLDKAVLS